MLPLFLLSLLFLWEIRKKARKRSESGWKGENGRKKGNGWKRGSGSKGGRKRRSGRKDGGESEEKSEGRERGFDEKNRAFGEISGVLEDAVFVGGFAKKKLFVCAV